MKKKLIFTFLILVCLLQLIPINRDNPPVEADLMAGKDVKSILKRSCYDCHSNETRYPMYSFLFPVSLFLKHHVEEGRTELNFSNWEKLSVSKKASKASDIIEEIEDKEMPLFSYTFLHREAALSKEEIQILKKWAESVENKNDR